MIYELMGIALFALLVGLIIYLPIYIVNRKKHGKKPFLRHFAVFSFIAASSVLVYATIIYMFGLRYDYISTFGEGPSFINLQPFVWVQQSYSIGVVPMAGQLILNVLMFVPFGLLLPIVFSKLRAFWKTSLCALCITVSIETIQYFVGRSADIDDVIMNLLGAMIGYAIFALAFRIFSQKQWYKNLLAVTPTTRSL